MKEALEMVKRLKIELHSDSYIFIFFKLIYFHIFQTHGSLSTSNGLDIVYGTFVKGMRAKVANFFI